MATASFTHDHGSLLRPSPPPGSRSVALSTWDHWSPKEYLTDYYSVVEPDEIETIRYVSTVARRVRNDPPAMVFGCGPTLHHVFPIAPYVSEIHVTDYLQSNLDEIRSWIEGGDSTHNWKAFVRYTIQCEGIADPNDDDIAVREEMVRRKITGLFRADAGEVDPLGREYRRSYPVVVSCYCADSATDDKDVWHRYMGNIASLVAGGGLFITAALRKARYYKVGDRYFPSADIDERDMALLLDRELGAAVVAEARVLPDHEAQGYTGIVLAHAVKRS